MGPDDPRSIEELAREQASGGQYRRSPRVQIALPCTLQRAKGSPVTAKTRDVGPGGMCCASTSRPLMVDERVGFDLSLSNGVRVGGQARVLREQDFGVYALRFEIVSDDVRAHLLEITR